MVDFARFACELRAEVSGDTLRGHAAVFDVAAHLPGQYEVMHRSAFDATLADDATDVRALFNHDPSMLLGRQSAGTLRVGTDEVGLTFEVDLPDTSYARDLRELVARGDLNGMSFGFVPGVDEWDRAPDGVARRTHTSIKALVDVSPVTFPAYDGTDVALRHMTFGTCRRSQLIRARARVLLGGVK